MPFFSPKGEPLQNPYEILKVEHGVTDDEISKAFKKLMLQLHPDKQRVGQSVEEADAVARLMHDVMDAKAFLLDAEHMAARRQYDSKLVLAKQQPLPFAPKQAKDPVPSHQTKVPNPSHHTKVPVAQQQHPTATRTPLYSTSKVRSNTVKESNRDGGKHVATKSGVTPGIHPLNKNLNVKRWGKAKRSRATGRAEAKKLDLLKKTNPRAKEKALNDSCGDCSTTDDTFGSDDELKRCHTNLNTTTECNAKKKNISRHNEVSKTRRSVPNPSDSRNIGGKRTSSVDPNGRRNLQQAATKSKPGRSKSCEGHVKSDRVIGNKTVGEDDIYVRREASRRSSDSPELVGYEHKPAPASKSTDHPVHTENGTRVNHTHKQPLMYESLRDAVDGFIEDLNSGSPSISVSQLDSSGMTSFLYTDFKFRLDVPSGISNNIIIQTWYEDNRKAFEISALVAKFNTSLRRTGVGGRLTFRKMNGKYVFSLTKQVQPEQFCKNSFRHGIEYFIEMSIKLHNIINVDDVRPLEKVRLTNSVAV
jgi:hypothetical protein